jgi:F-type H+-transporting ATPase subunit epsilon
VTAATGALHLSVLTPSGEIVSARVAKVTAEGTEGFFTLLPRHIDLAAALVPGLLSYVTPEGQERFLGMDEGVLVKCGNAVRVAVLRAFESDDLAGLRARVEAEFLVLDDHERGARTALARLEAGAIRGVFEVDR